MLNDEIRWIGWIIYAGMYNVINELLQMVLFIPNKIFNITDVNGLDTILNYNIYIFFGSLGIILIIFLLIRLFDWEYSKFIIIIKKYFLLMTIILSIPVIFTFFSNISKEIISDTNKIATMEHGNDEINIGVILANSFIEKNKSLESLSGYKEYENNPFQKPEDIYNEEIINAKIEDKNGEKKYIYRYINPILGICLNLIIIIMLIIISIKVIGYFFKIIIMKIFSPIILIFTTLDFTSVSNVLMEIIQAFISFAIQIEMINITIMLTFILINQNNDIYLNVVIILSSLYFMIISTDYIQSKFQSTTGISDITFNKNLKINEMKSDIFEDNNLMEKKIESPLYGEKTLNENNGIEFIMKNNKSMFNEKNNMIEESIDSSIDGSNKTNDYEYATGQITVDYNKNLNDYNLKSMEGIDNFNEFNNNLKTKKINDMNKQVKLNNENEINFKRNIKEIDEFYGIKQTIEQENIKIKADEVTNDYKIKDTVIGKKINKTTF